MIAINNQWEGLVIHCSTTLPIVSLNPRFSKTFWIKLSFNSIVCLLLIRLKCHPPSLSPFIIRSMKNCCCQNEVILYLTSRHKGKLTKRYRLHKNSFHSLSWNFGYPFVNNIAKVDRVKLTYLWRVVRLRNQNYWGQNQPAYHKVHWARGLRELGQIPST